MIIEMPYITILDFTQGEVFIERYEDSVEDVEEHFRSLGLMHDDCQWMTTDELKLNINCDE
jgi:hypothetical protein